MFPLLLISSSPFSLPSPRLSFLLPQQPCAQSFTQQAFAEPQWRVHPSQGQGDKNELRGFASEELIEEFVSLSPPSFPTIRLNCPPPHTPQKPQSPTKLLLKHLFFPPFFPRMLHNSPIPQDVYLLWGNLIWGGGSWKQWQAWEEGGGHWGEVKREGSLFLSHHPQLKKKVKQTEGPEKALHPKSALLLKTSSTFSPSPTPPHSFHRGWNQMLFSSFSSS